jgi:MYXO-CTERM domain-containing protein
VQIGSPRPPVHAIPEPAGAALLPLLALVALRWRRSHRGRSS